MLAESEELSHIHLHEDLGCADESVVRSVCVCVCAWIFCVRACVCVCACAFRRACREVVEEEEEGGGARRSKRAGGAGERERQRE